MDIMEIESKFGLKGYELLIFKVILDATESYGCFDRGDRFISRKVGCNDGEVRYYTRLLMDKGLIKKERISLYNQKVATVYRACSDLKEKAEQDKAYFETIFKD